MRVFILGDSHAAGISSSPAGKRFPSFTRAGWSTARYANEPEWDRSIRDARPDAVVVILGANDAAQSKDAYESQVRSVISRIRAAGVRHITWISPPTTVLPQLQARQERISLWQSEILPDIGVFLVSGRDLTSDLRSLLREDGVHFLSSGYAKWAARIFGGTLSMPGSGRASFSWGILVPLGITGLVVYLFWKTLNVQR